MSNTTEPNFWQNVGASAASGVTGGISGVIGGGLMGMFGGQGPDANTQIANSKKLMDTLYPGTTPYERLTAGGGGAAGPGTQVGIPNEQIKAQKQIAAQQASATREAARQSAEATRYAATEAARVKEREVTAFEDVNQKDIIIGKVLKSLYNFVAEDPTLGDRFKGLLDRVLNSGVTTPKPDPKPGAKGVRDWGIPDEKLRKWGIPLH